MKLWQSHDVVNLVCNQIRSLPLQTYDKLRDV